MKISTLLAVVVGLISLLSFTLVLSNPIDTPETLWLQDAFLGLSFTFGFGLGFPNWLAYITSAVIFLAVFLGSYAISQAIFKKIGQKLATN